MLRVQLAQTIPDDFSILHHQLDVQPQMRIGMPMFTRETEVVLPIFFLQRAVAQLYDARCGFLYFFSQFQSWQLKVKAVGDDQVGRLQRFDVGWNGLKSMRVNTIWNYANDIYINPANSANEGTVLKRQLDARTVYRPGELLESVPGLIVTQHSGEGKANQYFLRGFNHGSWHGCAYFC